MKINGTEGLTGAQVQNEISRGAKFVVYQYCISVLVITFRRGSDIYFVRAGESSVTPGLKYTLLSLFLGWWGIPWGPIFTVGALWTNLRGGKNITAEVIAALQPAASVSEVTVPAGPQNWWVK